MMRLLSSPGLWLDGTAPTRSPHPRAWSSPEASLSDGCFSRVPDPHIPQAAVLRGEGRGGARVIGLEHSAVIIEDPGPARAAPRC